MKDGTVDDEPLSPCGDILVGKSLPPRRGQSVRNKAGGSDVFRAHVAIDVDMQNFSVQSVVVD